MRYKDYNDYELLEAVLEEDEIAKQILLEKYKPLIFLVAKQYYQYALERQIEEVMLEDFTSVGEATLFTIAERYNDKMDVLFYTYFLHCLKSKYNSVLRSLLAKKNQPNIHYQALEYEIEDFGAATTYLEDNPCQLITYHYLQDQIANYLFQLSFLQQSVMELRLNGFRYQEIVSLLGVSKDFISKTIKKVREELKEIIN